MPQLDPSSFISQLCWLALCFSCLYFILSKLILPKIGNVLKQRADIIAQNLNQAESIRKEAERIEEQYIVALKDAKDKVANLIANTESEIKKHAEEKLQQFNLLAAENLRIKELDIIKLRSEIEHKYSNMTEELTKLMLSKLTNYDIDPQKIKNALNNS